MATLAIRKKKAQLRALHSVLDLLETYNATIKTTSSTRCRTCTGGYSSVRSFAACGRM